MIVRFWVEGTPLPVEGEDVYWFDIVKQWIGPLIYEDSANPGAYVPRPTFPKVEPSPPLPPPVQSWSSWVGGGVLSLFGGLIPSIGQKQPGENQPVQSTMFKRVMRPAPGEHFTGEAVAELKKVRLFLPPFCRLEQLLTNPLSTLIIALVVTLLAPSIFLVLDSQTQDPTTGNFVYTKLYVDIPDSRAPLAYRVKIPTAVVEPSTQAAPTYRFWHRTVSQ